MKLLSVLPLSLTLAAAAALLAFPTAPARSGPATGPLLRGQGRGGDWTSDAPGVRHHITVADLPQPYVTPSVDNGPTMVAPPEGALPRVPAGFRVEQFVSGLVNPRLIRTAPNGDIFLAESQPGRIRVLRSRPGATRPD